jgi:hypothetical protein
MTGARVRIVLRTLSLMQVRHVAPVGFGAATDIVDRVYRHMEREFGVLAPPPAIW